MDKSFRVGILLLLGVIIPLTFMMTPLYLRHKVYVDTQTYVSSPDFHVLHRRMSTVWCSAQTISMNGTFNAYLISGWPKFENTTRTYWTTKEFTLSSSRVKEHWRLYLPRGSHVTVGICARYPDNRLIIRKGRKSLKKCDQNQESQYQESKNSKGDKDDDRAADDETEYDDDDDENSDEDESSYTSGEEDLDLECSMVVMNDTIQPNRHCDDNTWYPSVRKVYSVYHTDYYYLVFSSSNPFPENKVYVNVTLQKPVYNVKEASATCANATECRLPFSFAGDQNVVLEIPDRKQWTSDVALTSCEPRTAIYFHFYLAVPISILFFAFRGNERQT